MQNSKMVIKITKITPIRGFRYNRYYFLLQMKKRNRLTNDNWKTVLQCIFFSPGMHDHSIQDDPYPIQVQIWLQGGYTYLVPIYV